MIPLRDNIPTRRFPLLTVSIILANVAFFVLDRVSGGYVRVEQPTPFGYVLVSHRFIGGLSAQYAMVPAHVTQDLTAYWPTIFTSMFLHANWLHIGGNMLYLWIFGNNVEDTLGRLRFLFFYFSCGFLAAAAQIYTDPASTVPVIGASGAIAGVMGAYLVLFPNASILSIVPIFFIGALMEVPAILVIGFWALIQFLNANMLGGGELLTGGGVAYFAHIGGFVGGILLVTLMGGRGLLRRRRDRDRYSNNLPPDFW
ncbi:MAG: rhomboid family intramembrane serine protease [Chthonomonadales bacterium]